MQAVAQMQALSRSPVVVQGPQQARCRALVASRLIVWPRKCLMTRCAQPTETEAATKERKADEEQEEETKTKEHKKDPLEEYCEDNPETDECRVYED